jgi:CHAT domain-containing protein
LRVKLNIFFLVIFKLSLISQSLQLQKAIQAHQLGANRIAIDLLNKINYTALHKTEKVDYWKTYYFSNYDIHNMSRSKSASYNLWILENPKKNTNSIYTAQHYAYMALCYHFDARADSATIFSDKALKILRQNKLDIYKIDYYQVYKSHASAARNYMPNKMFSDLYKNGKIDEYNRLRENYIMAYFDTAMIYCKKQHGKNSIDYANILRNRANAYLDFYSYYCNYQKEKSENCHSKIVALYTLSNQIIEEYYGTNNPGIADNFLLLGLTEFYNNNQKKALDYFNKSEKLIFCRDENDQVISCFNSQALDYYRYVSLAYSLDFKENKKQSVALKCIELFKKAVPTYLSHLQESNLMAEEALIDLYDQNPLSSLSGIYIELYDITKNKKYLDSAFYYSEKVKQLTLLYFNRNKVFSTQIRKQHVENENKVIFQNKKNIITNKLGFDITEIKSISTQNIQSHLRSNEAFISYSFANSNLFGEVLMAFVITKTKNECVKLSIEKYNNLSETNKFSLLKDSLPIVFKNYSSKIYKQYFNPLTPFIDSSIKHLYISPVEQLNDFPFELLVMKNSKTNTYNYTDFLISKYSISYLFASKLALPVTIKKSNSYNLNLLVPNLSFYKLADLPFCSKISENIANNYKNSKVNYSAKTSDFYQGLASPNHILQVFTHSGIDNQTTSNSKLYFSDGIVPMNDIYTKKINSPLIFLSSCETDLGLNSENDGQLNFVRALNFAGAKSIVSTFWKSDDKATAYISLYFYNYLAKGFNKAEALQKAQQKFITNFPQLNNPLYWAAFKITGDICNLPIKESEQFSNLSIFFTLIVVALLGGYLLFFKK